MKKLSTCYRGQETGAAIEMQKKTRSPIKKTLLLIFSRNSELNFVLMVFQWTGVRSGDC